jgi:hypothetical protein
MAIFFISYSRNDAAVANLIRDHIYRLDSSHDVFIDTKSLKTGVNWGNELRRRIKGCDYFIYIHSKHSLKSSFVKNELKWACESELKTGIRKIIVYRLGYADLIPQIINYQILDQTENFAVDFHKLMQGAMAENSFYSVEYDITLKNESQYKGRIWIDAPKRYLEKIQMVEYRFDYLFYEEDQMKTVYASQRNIEKKFMVDFITSYHFTIFVMVYLWNTKELAFVKKIPISH